MGIQKPTSIVKQFFYNLSFSLLLGKVHGNQNFWRAQILRFSIYCWKRISLEAVDLPLLSGNLYLPFIVFLC